jgi:hypothetical protein
MEIDGEEPPDPYQTFEQTGFPKEVLETVSAERPGLGGCWLASFGS